MANDITLGLGSELQLGMGLASFLSHEVVIIRGKGLGGECPTPQLTGVLLGTAAVN